jgi:Ca2+/H+ antiporter, TMEM165/GDT1 family
MQGLALFASVFGVIFVAELPDKTALAALVLATRHRPVPVLVGAGAALTVQSLIAVTAGQLVSLLPERPVHVVAGVLFLFAAVMMWRKREEPANAEGATGQQGFWRSTWLAFAVVFIAEWGDLTQLATAALAARYHAPVVVFAAATTALWSVAGLATLIGARAGRLLDPARTKRVAAVLFALVGSSLMAGVV